MLCLLKKAGQALVSCVGGSPGGAMKSLAAQTARTPPDYPHTVLMVTQIGSVLSWVGGPDPEDAPCQFIPLYPFLGSGMVMGSAPHDMSGGINGWSENVERYAGKSGREAEAGYPCLPRMA